MRRGLFPRSCSGAVAHLGEQMDVSKLPMTASSGGGLVAVLAACSVSPETAVDHAFQLCQKHRWAPLAASQMSRCMH